LPGIHNPTRRVRVNFGYDEEDVAMRSFTLKLNGKPITIEAEPDTPLLWAIRDGAGLLGTKYSCGISVCGSCTVLINGEAVRSCSIPVSAAAGQDVTTIEGLNSRAGEAVKKAWVELSVPQCGYCHSGQIIAAAVLLSKNPKPSEAEIDSAMSGILCRCGTYQRIKAAINIASRSLGGSASGEGPQILPV
jgi:isoquinoline 1-oxidoreductase alpha subunit